ncbi:MAG TPA: hypothetical protein V6D17_22090 [Candidatus Obscuribacterales bacterium]
MENVHYCLNDWYPLILVFLGFIAIAVVCSIETAERVLISLSNLLASAEKAVIRSNSESARHSLAQAFRLRDEAVLKMTEGRQKEALAHARAARVLARQALEIAAANPGEK